MCGEKLQNFESNNCKNSEETNGRSSKKIRTCIVTKEEAAGRCSSFDSSVADVKTTKTLLFDKK